MLIAGKVAGLVALKFTAFQRFRPEEIELAHGLVNQAMLAILLQRLSEHTRRTAVMAERDRMARDVHDSVAQGFTGVIVHLEAADEAAAQGLIAGAAENRARAAAIARDGLQEARRSVMALRPLALEQHDLEAALRDLLRRMTAGTPVAGEFRVHGTPRPLAPRWDENLLRVGQEALTNALRHGGPRRLVMRLVFDPEELRFEVCDDGQGFDPATATAGAGLAGIRSRVASMGGRTRVDTVVGGGTTVAVTVPLAAAAERR
jgi:signal transduction histidine kinase